MQLYFVVILSFMYVIGNSAVACPNGQCNWSQWGHWSNCTSYCGGGASRRFKHLCCDKSYTTIEKCSAHCNITAKDYIEKRVCGQTCVNGVFRQNKCQCPQNFTGKCCESESCKQGCKFGNCKAGKCSCMTLFKGTTCNKPKLWFIVAAAVFGTITFLMTVCCIGRFCCGKFPTHSIEDDVSSDLYKT